MSKTSVILMVFVLIACIAIGLVIIKPWQKEPQISYPQSPSQHFPTEGEQIVVSIVSGHDDGTPVAGVKISFQDQKDGFTDVRTTTDQGIADITLICGHTYNINAEFNSITKSTNHTFKLPEIVGVLISTQGTISSIVFEQFLYP